MKSDISIVIQLNKIQQNYENPVICVKFLLIKN